jgi:hypothetical protein
MVNDLSPDWGSNQTISNMNALRDAIEDKDWKKGHILLEGNNFNISGARNLKERKFNLMTTRNLL